MPFFTTTEAGVPIQGPSATLLYDDWYPALRTDTLRKHKLAKAMLLGIPLVLGRRNDGAVFAVGESLPAPRHPPQRRLVHRPTRHLPLSRMGIRALLRPL